MASDDIWYITKWLEQVVSIKSDSDPPQKKRKRDDGLSMAFVDDGELL